MTTQCDAVLELLGSGQVAESKVGETTYRMTREPVGVHHKITRIDRDGNRTELWIPTDLLEQWALIQSIRAKLERWSESR